MRLHRSVVTSLGAVCVIQSAVVAQEVTVGGQVRPRIEYRDPFLPGMTGGDWFVSARVRGEISALLERNVKVFIQFQDVRMWGEEGSTLDADADNFDLHQGYFEVHGGSSTTFSARVGRQAISLGGQRLVGAVNWSQQGRSFDAVRLSADGNALRLDLIGAVLANDLSAMLNTDESLLGLYGQWKEAGPGTLDLYGLYRKTTGGIEASRAMLGARWWGQQGSISYRVEGSYQTGDRQNATISAFMLGGRVGTRLLDGAASVTLWYDYLSGDDDPTDDEIKVFDTWFGTNHKYYGFADYFLDIPAHTASRGLQDLALKGTWAPTNAVTLRADLHSFHAAQSAGLTTGHFADEIDIIATYRYTQNLGISGGIAYVMAADGIVEIGRLVEDVVWTYVMMDASF